MIALETVTHETFCQLTGGTFVTDYAGARVELRLVVVQTLGHRREEALREPFSLTLRGVKGLRLPQGIYHFACEPLGELEIFITQQADVAEGSEFEAIFT